LGLNVMLNVQVAPTAIVDGQSLVKAKSCQLRPFILGETGCDVLPVLVRVTALGALVVLTVWLPNAMSFGFTEKVLLSVTVMPAVAVALPSEPVTVIVYVVVDAGLTLVLPLVHAMDPTPLLIAQVVALVIPLHESVDESPLRMVAGLAVKLPIVGALGLYTVTLLVAVIDPPGPEAVSI